MTHTDLIARLEAGDESVTNEEVLRMAGAGWESGVLGDGTSTSPYWTIGETEFGISWDRHNMQDCLDLLAAILPGWEAIIDTRGEVELIPPEDLTEYQGFAGNCKDNPCNALLVAVLKATGEG